MLSEQEYFADDAADRRVAAQIAAKLSDQLQGFTDRADTVYTWLRQRESLFPVFIKVGPPTITQQDGSPLAEGIPATRTGANMAVTMADNQNANYPAATSVDSKGFTVPGDQISVTESSGGAVVALTVNADGSSVFAGVTPGSATASWTDPEGNTFQDSINVTPGGAVSIEVGPPTITDQGA